MENEAQRKDLRSEQIFSIRPQLNLEKDSTGSNEQFQNEVLRPILKFQNDLLLAFFEGSKQFHQQIAKVDKTNLKSYELGLRDFLKTNNTFRNKCIGLILALMTVEELKIYLADEAEYKRRIISMLVKRIFGQLN